MDADLQSGSASQPVDLIMPIPVLVDTACSRPLREAGLLSAELR